MKNLFLLKVAVTIAFLISAGTSVNAQRGGRSGGGQRNAPATQSRQAPANNSSSSKAAAPATNDVGNKTAAPANNATGNNTNTKDVNQTQTMVPAVAGM